MSLSSAFLWPLAAAFALSGCGVLSAPFSTLHCGAGGQCKVQVMVDANCRVSADPERLDVPTGGEMHIHWKVDPPYVFDLNGIAFKPGRNRGQFDQKELQDGGRQFHWRDKNTLAGEYPYDINVRDPGGRLCHADPFIRNQ